jgi:hypothetical protein
MFKSGALIIHWGATVSPDGSTSNAVLAYTNETPEKGGRVLMQDGTTLKTMNANQLKAARLVK